MTSNIERCVVCILKKYQCTICGYVYDPVVGDSDSGIASRTPFEELPEDWVCPLCGAMKDDFKAV
ncbi:MAG: rubredoxin [Methanotrichaceae archaeon]|nr:rubredoxin [Methanotrichaceae archaeon]